MLQQLCFHLLMHSLLPQVRRLQTALLAACRGGPEAVSAQHSHGGTPPTPPPLQEWQLAGWRCRLYWALPPCLELQLRLLSQQVTAQRISCNAWIWLTVLAAADQACLLVLLYSHVLL